MNLRNFEYLIQEAFIGIWRNGIMALASISTVALSMAVLGAFLLLVFGSHRFVERQLAGFELKVFLPRGATVTEARVVRDAIADLPLAKSVKLLSREKEWSEFKRDMSTDISLGGVVENPLPYSLDVVSKESRKTSVLAGQIRQIPNVRRVADAREEYRLVKGLADLVKVLGFAAAVILCFTTVFIISNAIRLTLYARRHEIKIMQLVGATNWFIRAPLIIEGVVLGAVGAVVAIGLISAGSEYVAMFVQKALPPTLRDLSSGVDRRQLVSLLVVGGAGIGALGSLVSIRRFLKV